VEIRLPEDAANLIGRSATASVLTRSSSVYPPCHSAANTRNSNKTLSPACSKSHTTPSKGNVVMRKQCLVTEGQSDCDRQKTDVS
jgi:hypothetical protein